MKKDDVLFTAACDYVRVSGIASNTNLQAQFGMGTGRARKLLARMEAVGLIGPAAKNGHREVFPDLKPKKPRGGKTMTGRDDGFEKALARVKEVGKASEDDLMRSLGATQIQAGLWILALVREDLIAADRDSLGRHDLTEKGLADTGPTLHPTDAQEAAEERARARDSSTTPHDVRSGSNQVSGGELTSLIERWEQALKEKKGKNDLVAEIRQEVKSKGYDVTITGNIVKERAQKPSAREEQQAVTELYRAALGMRNEPPLFRHLTGLGMDPAVRESVITALGEICPMDSTITIRGPQVSLQIGRNRDGVTVGEAPAEVPTAGGEEDEEPVIDESDEIDEDKAREMGADARKDDVAIVKNPFPSNDPRRGAWDDGWREQDGGDGFGGRK